MAARIGHRGRCRPLSIALATSYLLGGQVGSAAFPSVPDEPLGRQAWAAMLTRADDAFDDPDEPNVSCPSQRTSAVDPFLAAFIRSPAGDTATHVMQHQILEPRSNDIAIPNRQQDILDALGATTGLRALEWSLATKHRMGVTQPSCSLVRGLESFLGQTVEFDLKLAK